MGPGETGCVQGNAANADKNHQNHSNHQHSSLQSITNTGRNYIEVVFCNGFQICHLGTASWQGWRGQTSVNCTSQQDQVAFQQQ